MNQNHNYSRELQKLYLEMFLSDAESFIRCQNIFEPENFDKSLRTAAKFITEHVDQYRVMPEVDIVNAACGSDFQQVELARENYQWLLDEFEQFSRHRGLERAILKSADLLERGEYGPVEKMIKDAVQISLSRDMGTDYFEDPRGRLGSLKDNNGQVSTGWPTVDRRLYGGFNRGELNIFAAASGGGKSLFLSNLAVNWAMMGLNVIYLTFELSENLVAMRLDSMFTGISTREIFKNLDDVELKVKLMGKKSGHIQVKYLPSGKNCNDIRAYLKEYQVKKNIRPDVILIDYLDLMMPISVKVSPSDLFVKDKYVSEEIRNLAMESQCITVTASQLNRCLALDTKVIANGHEIEIKDVKVGDWIESNQGPVQVQERLPIVKQSVYKIKTKSGKTIICSDRHLFPTHQGLRSINNGLSVGDKLHSTSMEYKSQTGVEDHSKKNTRAF
jgi:archaellum biogenesis ATPase FlaH